MESVKAKQASRCVLLAWTLLKEPLTWNLLVTLPLVLAGLYLIWAGKDKVERVRSR